MDSGSKDWTLFGWEGISFITPNGWDLSLIEGEDRKGYLRIDDSHMARIEVKWERSRGHFSPTKIADRYIQNLKRTVKKTSDFEVERNVKIKDTQFILKRGKGEFFIVRQEDLNSYCLAWNCGVCNRVLLMRVLAKSEEDFDGIVGKIYRSLKDHSIRGMNTWSIYGFLFRLPDDFVLEKRSLLSGRIQLTFKNKQERLQIERLSLADLLLENDSLENWFRNFFRKDLWSFEYRLQKEEGLRHDVLRIDGIAKRKIISFGHLGKKKLLNGYLWKCPLSNKIFLLMHINATTNERLLKRLYQQIKCH